MYTNKFTKKSVTDVLIIILDPYVGQSFSKIIIFMSSVENQKWNLEYLYKYSTLLIVFQTCY